MNISAHLKQRLLGGRLRQGLILTGGQRQALSDYLAMAYVCQGPARPCEICLHCRKAKAGIHPDIITVGIPGESLKVDDIRALRADAYIRPNEAERKVYVLPAAETMNQSGQNALLKLLEEGPDYAAFFFLAPNPEQLLSTVRSRCEVVDSGLEAAQAEPGEEAGAFVQLLCGQDELALMEFCVGLEKKKREELCALLDESIGLLAQKLQRDPKGLLPQMEVLRDLRAACDYTIGAGHVAGWLMARLLH